MKAVAELKTELTVEERNLLSVAFKVSRRSEGKRKKKAKKRREINFSHCAVGRT